MGPPHHPPTPFDPLRTEDVLAPPVAAPGASSLGTIEARLAALPTYYDWKDLLRVFDADQDRLIDAYIDGTLGVAPRRVLEETLPPARLQAWLLRYAIRRLVIATPSRP